MNKKKKTIVIIAACVAAIFIAGCVLCSIKFKRRVFFLNHTGLGISIFVYSHQSIFERILAPGFMGQTYDYDIVISGDSSSRRYVNSSFTYADDGSPIDFSSFYFDADGNNVRVTISGSEMNDVVYYITLEGTDELV